MSVEVILVLELSTTLSVYAEVFGMFYVCDFAGIELILKGKTVSTLTALKNYNPYVHICDRPMTADC